VPFTLAHIAAVVPLSRSHRALRLAPLAIGSMAPDFEYFLLQSQAGTFGHTLPGLVLFGVPAGLAALWLFERVLRPAALALLPPETERALAPRAEPVAFWPPPRLAWLAVLILLGALTHVAWDSCTHAHGWTVRQVPALRASLLTWAGADLRVFKVLQHGSTLAGLALLAFWSARALQERLGRAVTVRDLVPDGARRRGLVALLATAAFAGVVAGSLAVHGQDGLAAATAFVVRGTVGALSATVAVLAVASGLARVRAGSTGS
jgi:hypothetical protein